MDIGKEGCPHGEFYTIKKSDTIFSIAARFELELSALLEANAYFDPGFYIPGQRMVIPKAPARTHVHRS